jgi:hypothetical protein
MLAKLPSATAKWAEIVFRSIDLGRIDIWIRMNQQNMAENEAHTVGTRSKPQILRLRLALNHPSDEDRRWGPGHAPIYAQEDNLFLVRTFGTGH